jgi:hypothetical protein
VVGILVGVLHLRFDETLIACHQPVQRDLGIGAGDPPPPVACQAWCGRDRVAPLSCKTFGERVVEQRIMARGFSGSICRHPASSIGNVRNKRLRHGAFLSWTLHVNGGRVSRSVR